MRILRPVTNEFTVTFRRLGGNIWLYASYSVAESEKKALNTLP
jgi:hypothetical protein